MIDNEQKRNNELEEIVKHQQLKLQSQEQELLSKNYEVESLQNELKEKQHEIASLRYQLNCHLSKKYDKTSDVVPPEQLRLFDELEIEDEVNTSHKEETSEITIKSHKRTTSKQKPLPQDLLREELVIDIDEKDKICHCGCTLKRMGEEISEKLDITPAQVKVLKIIRPKYVCSCEDGVQLESMPKTAIPKGLATPGTLSHVILSKYEDHLPLYRQELIFQRMGVDIPRNTICGWILKCSELLEPLHKLMKEDLLNSNYIQADETPVKVLRQPEGVSNRHYMWCYLSRAPNKPINIYEHHNSRGGYIVQNFLKCFTGILHTDGYAGYNKVDNVTHGACFAHVRRKFVDIVKNTNKTGVARVVVGYIGKLYNIEKQAKDNYLSHKDRQTLRQLHAPPILEELYKYLQDKRFKAPPKAPLGKAISYTLKLWDKLTIYVNYGQMEIDTNLVENSIRPFAIGRKNWLFKGSNRGAKAGSIIYSILLTCKANNIEPYAYLKYILYKIPKISEEQLYELLPYNIEHKKFSDAYNKTWY